MNSMGTCVLLVITLACALVSIALTKAIRVKAIAKRKSVDNLLIMLMSDLLVLRGREKNIEGAPHKSDLRTARAVGANALNKLSNRAAREQDDISVVLTVSNKSRSR